MNDNEKIKLTNEVTVNARIYDDHKSYLQEQNFGFIFYYGELSPRTKDDTIRQLDAGWEQVKSKIIKELYGD